MFGRLVHILLNGNILPAVPIPAFCLLTSCMQYASCQQACFADLDMIRQVVELILGIADVWSPTKMHRACACIVMIFYINLLSRQWCANHSDSFCCICGKYTLTNQHKNLTKKVTIACKYCFKCKV